MNRIATALVAGLLFGLGLAISGMTEPAKVLNFLDVAGQWDGSLALVMLSALVVSVPVFTWVRHRGSSLDGEALPPSPPAAIDRDLLVGSAVFGIGWGIAGYCPGPALANIAGGSVDAALFVVAMLAGAQGVRFIRRKGTV